MATAPQPGAGARNAEAKAAQAMMTMTLLGETRSIAMNNVPLRQRLLVRQETGKSWDSFIGEFGLDSLQVIWWIAGRLNGHPNLTLDEVAEAWPDDLGEDDLEIKDLTTPDPEDDSPEA